MSKKRPSWKKQEKRLAKEGARTQPGSGNGYQKGDNKGQEFLVQCKTTAKRQATIRMSDIRKMVDDANREERIPVMQQELGDGDLQLAVLCWDDFKALLEQAGMDL